MAVLTSTHNLCFEQKYENYQSFFYLKNFQFLQAKFSIYLNRRVFVIMHIHDKNKKGSLAYPKAFAFLSYRKKNQLLKNEFESARVNKPSVFESLKFYCI